ncbi:hypothetical protein Naga_100089g2 [Nannochloropsis gaditana]|uniref:Uncharacterized protein n=1 Tax=Nannochloropsis gaditana TaxID=72520 RepID=W7TE00_9STRA|nr:hypothetical protein Naga_100089g2 [Nannochloropsis gaditana]
MRFQYSSTMAVFLVLLLAMTVVVIEGVIRCDTTAKEREMIVEDALGNLRESQDFQVIQGTLTFNHRQIGNPAGRYGTVSFPTWSQPLGLCKSTTFNQTSPIPFSFCNIAFTLGPRDAIVWLGCTPPPAAYFSIRSYVAFRFSPSVWFPAAELGDPANHMTLNSTGGPEDPFEKTTMVFSTGDRETARHVKRAFAKAGFPRGSSNLDVIPAELARFRERQETAFWVQDKSDAFAWQFRVSQFEDPEAAEAYFDQTWPVYFLRARPEYEKRGAKPIPRPEARPRGTGQDEAYLHPSLDKLEEEIIVAYASKGSKLSYRFPMDHIVPDIERCLTDPQYAPIFKPVPAWHFPGWPSCDWFSADALYTGLPDTTDLSALTFPTNRTFVVMGVNQPRLQKSIYSNLMLTAVAHFEDPAHSVNLTATELQGSASMFAPELEYSDDVWAYSFSRDCASGQLGLGGPLYCRTVTPSMINETEFLFVVERKYLELATKTGPAPAEVMPPLVLVFDKMEEEEDSMLGEGMREEDLSRPALRRRI